MKNKYAAEVCYSDGSLPERFDSWMKKTLRNLIRTEVRSYRRWKDRTQEMLVEDVDDLEGYDPFEDDGMVETSIGDTPLLFGNDRLVKALLKVSPKKKQVIEGTIILGIPVRIVAKRLGLDEQTVSNYKSLTLKQLRDLMKEDEDEQEE